MNQKSCELETDTTTAAATSYCMLENVLIKSQIHPCLKEFTIWIGKAQEGERLEQRLGKMTDVTIAPSQRVLPATLQ